MGPTKFGGGRWPLFWYGDVAEPSKYASSQLYYLPYSVIPSVFSSYFEENTLIHYHNTRQNISSIFLLYPLNMEKGPSNIKVLNFGIIFLSMLRKLKQSFKHKIQEFILVLGLMICICIN